MPYASILAVCLLLLPTAARAYSVLTHEAIVDTLWIDSIEPVLKARFPDTTADQLVKAHAFAYGGCIIQDLGYYPFGSHFFSDLVHYVRSADFIQSLLDEAKTVDETAFALGALAHYGADVDGHAIAVNRAVPLLFPKLRAKFGSEVTYADDPGSHLKTEFGFDVLQVARGHYAPASYHAFIGFEVSKDLLTAAFEKTYGLRMQDLFGSLDLSLATYRFSVSRLIPGVTRAAWKLKEKEIRAAEPGVSLRQFRYNLNRASFNKEWGSKYQRPGFGTQVITFVAKVMPRVGPLKGLGYVVPVPETERMFEASFDAAVARDKKNFADARAGVLHVANRDLDTGASVRPGEYSFSDKTYDRLLTKLSEKKFERLTPALAADILNFYATMPSPDSHGAELALNSLKAWLADKSSH
ncbi:MAG: hypothetical protein JWN34_3842 [Bryobacterales bacterium]|nr:hypothetical protein [Bryobacterales bacterium]